MADLSKAVGDGDAGCNLKSLSSAGAIREPISQWLIKMAELVLSAQGQLLFCGHESERLGECCRGRDFRGVDHEWGV